MPNIKTKKINPVFKFKKGFTLIETLFALTIVTAGFFSIFSLVRMGIATTTTSINQLIAANLAQEGAEIIRNIRDSHYVSGNNWQDILVAFNGGACADCEADINSSSLNDLGDPYLKISSSFQYQYLLGEDSLFKRRISVFQGEGVCQAEIANPDDCLQVKINVSWQEKGRNLAIDVEDYIFNLY